MKNIGGLKALQAKMINETCCVTGKSLDDGRPAIVRIKREDGTVMTINGKVAKRVRKGTRYFLGGKVLSCIRNNVEMTLERTRSGKVYARCSTQTPRIQSPATPENLPSLDKLPAHIRKNILAKRAQISKVWSKGG